MTRSIWIFPGDYTFICDRLGYLKKLLLVTAPEFSRHTGVPVAVATIQHCNKCRLQFGRPTSEEKKADANAQRLDARGCNGTRRSPRREADAHDITALGPRRQVIARPNSDA